MWEFIFGKSDGKSVCFHKRFLYVFIRDSYKIFREGSPGFEIDKADATFTRVLFKTGLWKNSKKAYEVDSIISQVTDYQPAT